MDPKTSLNIVYTKILEKVIIKCVYEQDDNFLFWSFFTNNIKTIKSMFPDAEAQDLCFNTSLDTEFETFDCRLGKKVTVNLTKFDCISIPELPFEFSPAFLFNEKYESHIKNFPFQKIQKRTILDLKKYNIVSDKDSTILTPKVVFLEKVKPGCDILKITTLESLSPKKSALKSAFLNYKKELNKHFKYLFSEFDQEKKVLQKRVTKGCPFSGESLKTLAELEDAAKKEQDEIDIKNYLIPLDMLCSWPKSLLPAPEWILTDDAIVNNISNYKGSIIYNKEAFLNYYNSIINSIGVFYKYNIINKASNDVEVKIVGIRSNTDTIEILSIPTKDSIAQQVNFEPFNIYINTNAYAINHLIFEREESGKLVDAVTGYSLTIENETIYLKEDSDTVVFEAIKQWPTPVSKEEVLEQLSSFLIVG